VGNWEGDAEGCCEVSMDGINVGVKDGEDEGFSEGN
jgi:hypothetical protein